MRIIYDTGPSRTCYNVASTFFSTDEIDWLILSHPDADHIAGAKYILDGYKVGNILRTGLTRWDKKTWKVVNDRIAAEVAHEGASVYDLSTFTISPGDILFSNEKINL